MLSLIFLGVKNKWIFSNGLINGEFIQPEHSIDGFVQEIEKAKIASNGLRERLKGVQDFLRTQQGEILEVYKEFLQL